jgi:hypothetical protein
LLSVIVAVTQTVEAVGFVNVYESKLRDPVALAPGFALATPQVLCVPLPLRFKRPVCAPVAVTGKLTLLAARHQA